MDLVTAAPTITTMSPEAEAAGIGFLLGGLAFLGVTMIIIALVIYVLLVIAWWKIFVKAGEKGWKSLIPIYNLYIMFKLFWNTNMFWIFLGVVFGASLLGTIFANINLAILGSILSLGSSIFALVIDILLSNRMSKSFGHGAGFTVGLIFLPNIFTLILGFNKDKYTKIAA